jgi:hypothetical protein
VYFGLAFVLKVRKVIVMKEWTIFLGLDKSLDQGRRGHEVSGGSRKLSLGPAMCSHSTPL